MDAEPILAFAGEILRALGAPADSAECVAAHLVDADRAGAGTHGVGLLPLYAEMIRAGALDPRARPVLERAPGSIATVDGRNAFGQLTGRLAVGAGVDAARENGIVAVGIRNGAHLGRLGDWARMAASSGILFMAFCNTGGGARNVAPHGGRTRRLSTNPVAFGVPAFGALPRDVIADFATSQVSGSVIRECFLDARPLQPDWAVTAHGAPLTDAGAFMQGEGALLPLGGRATGHKGYALAVVAEILGGMAGGLMAGEHDGDWFSNAALFLFVDPLAFGSREAIGDRIRNLAVYLEAAGARLPGSSPGPAAHAGPDELELEAHVCRALARLADGLRVAVPRPLAEVAGSAPAPDRTRTW